MFASITWEEARPWLDGRTLHAQGLLDKLQSDTTRLAAVKAFGRVAESPLRLDLAPVLDRLLSALTSYLRKSNRLLRQAALAALEVCSPPLQPAHGTTLLDVPNILQSRMTFSFLHKLPPKLRRHL